MSTSTIATPRTRYTDDTAHRHAVEYAVTVLGLDAEPDVVWDREHHLQGHLAVSGRNLVLIAPRTSGRAARLFTRDEWDGLRRGLHAA